MLLEYWDENLVENDTDILWIAERVTHVPVIDDFVRLKDKLYIVSGRTFNPERDRILIYCKVLK